MSRTKTVHCSPLFAEYARRRPSGDTSKLPNCQIFFKNRSGVNVTLRPMKPCYWGRSVGTKSHLVPGLLSIHVAERRDPSHHVRRRCVSSSRTRAPSLPEDLRPFEELVADHT